MVARRVIAADVLRALLDEARSQAERERTGANRLRTAIRAGSLAGLSAQDLAAASGLSRPGIYEVLKGRPSGPVTGLDEIILAALATRGGGTRAELAESLRVDDGDLDQAVARLVQRGAVVAASAGYDEPPAAEVLLVASHGEELVTNELRRAFSRRRDCWVAYLAVTADEGEKLYPAARDRFGDRNVALLAETVRSDMSTSELALAFDAANEVELFNQAAAAWHELREDAGLGPTPVKLVAFLPPRLRSEVVEAFAQGIISARPDLGKEIALATKSLPAGDEFALCANALTEAAWALRRSVGQDERPPAFLDGAAAFAELQRVAGLPLDAKREESRRALVLALERATDTFGSDGANPPASRRVEPTRIDLIEIAQRSGQAVGLLSTAEDADVDPVQLVKQVASP